MTNNKQTDRTDVSQTARKDSVGRDPIPVRFRVAAAIGRAALWGLLPTRLAERLIRWARSA
jgi:hypothetical protein